MRQALSAAFVASLLALSACGSDDDPQGATPADDEPAPVEEVEEEPAPIVEEAPEEAEEEVEEVDEPEEVEEVEEPAEVERPALTMDPQSAGPITVTPTECVFEGYDLVGPRSANDFAFAGERAFISHEGVRAFTLSGGDDCVFTLDTELGDAGVLSDNDNLRSLSGSPDGRLVASGVTGSMVFDTNEGLSYECGSMTGEVALSPDGSEALMNFPGREAVERWELTDTICNEVGSLSFDEIPVVRFLNFDGSALLVGGDDVNEVKTGARFEGGSMQWQVGNDETGAPDWFGWVHGMAPCGPFTCLIDTNTDKIAIIDGAAGVVAAFNFSDLVGIRGWIEPILIGPDGANYVLYNKAVDDEDGERTNFGSVIRLEVTG